VQTLIFLAGLQKADKTVYEAASIDGANLWDSFWKITLPGLHSLMIINIIYTAVIYANLSNNRLVVLIENTLVDVRFGRPYSTALAWILFVIELLIIGIYTLLIKLSNKRYQ
jgi:ABC-type sugar transport system permease subunit